MLSRGAIKNKMMEMIFNFGRVHFATISGKGVPKDQLSVALTTLPLRLMRVKVAIVLEICYLSSIQKNWG